MKEFKVYTAGPLFTQEEVKVCETVENLLKENDFKYFSPRLDTAVYGKMLGTATKELNEAQTEKDKKVAITARLSAAKCIFEENCKAICEANAVIANIDGRDPGTMFEIGFAYGHNVPVVTYSTHNYGVNIMISQASIMHCTNFDDLMKVLALLRAKYTKDEIIKEMNFVDDREQI